MRKTASVFLSITLGIASAANKLTPISTSKYEHAIAAKTDQGDTFLVAREMLVDITYTDGRPRKGALLVLFDSSSGNYMWEFGLVGQNENASTMTIGYGTSGLVHAASGRLTHFAFRPPFLMVHESATKANGIEDAEAKAFVEATDRLPAKLARKMDDRVIINLMKVLAREFFLACAQCVGPGPTRIVNITRNGSTWELVLQGQWQERIILNQKYEITGHNRIN